MGTDDPNELLAQARLEISGWIGRRLLTERAAKPQATDALQHALAFAAGLRQRIMTSTTSRLATVQREAEALALNPDGEARAAALERRIEALQAELADVRAGRVQVLAVNRSQRVARRFAIHATTQPHGGDALYKAFWRGKKAVLIGHRVPVGRRAQRP